MYQITTHSSKDGDGVYISRIKQYVQCDKGNHLTSETKPVEQFNMRADAVRALANLVAEELTMNNTGVLAAYNGYAKIYYRYSNGDEEVEYTVEAVKA